MSETIVREKRQAMIPTDVLEAAGIKVNDVLDWQFEDGKIVGRKVGEAEEEVLDIADVDPITFVPKRAP